MGESLAKVAAGKERGWREVAGVLEDGMDVVSVGLIAIAVVRGGGGIWVEGRIVLLVMALSIRLQLAPATHAALLRPAAPSSLRLTPHARFYSFI